MLLEDAVVAAVFGERFTEAELDTLNDLLGRLPGAGDVDGECCTT